MSARYDAVVIGAGVAGASAAILLARAGWRVAIVEKQAFPRRKVCGECIAATNLPLLEALGIGADLHALAGPPLREVALMAGERIIRADFPAYGTGRHAFGLALGRETLDTLLLDQARRHGVEVYQPWMARRIEAAPDGFVCTLARVHEARSAVLQAPVVIDAHGSWETLHDRAAPSKPPPHRPSDLFAFKANFAGSGLEPGLLPVLSFPGGYGGMVIGDGARTTLAFCIRRDLLELLRRQHPGRKAAEAALEHVLQSCRGVRERLDGARLDDAWLGVGPLRPGVRRSVSVTAMR